ncbi:MAG: hypothetical protein KDA81_07595 [Planctomycetaceae bacterium]|nr:hypothetical protein [Planctomycetaceae bacterium]
MSHFSLKSTSNGTQNEGAQQESPLVIDLSRRVRFRGVANVESPVPRVETDGLNVIQSWLTIPGL